jgi:glucuronate isomerase
MFSAVRRLHSRNSGLKSNRLVPETDVTIELVERLFDRLPVRVTVDHDARTATAAEKLVKRHLRDFRFDVPERHVDGCDRRHRHRTSAPVRSAIKILPNVFDLMRIAADQARNHVFFEVRDDSELAAVESRVAETEDTFVGDEFQRHEIAVGARDDHPTFEDLHGAGSFRLWASTDAFNLSQKIDVKRLSQEKVSKMSLRENSGDHLLHPDRLFPVDSGTRAFTRRLYDTVKTLPIVSPHGHTDPEWFASNAPFTDPVSLLITPDHYVLRMLYSQGVPMQDLGVEPVDGSAHERDARKIWQLFASKFHLFRGTPSDLWMKHVFHEIFGIDKPFTSENADFYFDAMSDKLRSSSFTPRALFERFGIEVLATTDAATDSLEAHSKIKKEWRGRVIPTYRPDAAVDPEHETFSWSLDELTRLTGEDARTWKGYLRAHAKRRQFFKMMGATATDHGHPSALTFDLGDAQAEALFARIQKPNLDPNEAELFRALMLVKFAEMSLDDGLVMQIHAGSARNHNGSVMRKFGRDKGADIPMAMEYSRSLQALLNKVGNDPRATIILFTLDESTYARELAPLAGHYPALRLGAPWWFHDSPEGMMRYRRQVTETAGFANTTGFVDDTRAFFSIPARHDVARRMDCRFLAELVAEHRLTERDAYELAQDLAVGLARKAYKI